MKICYREDCSVEIPVNRKFCSVSCSSKSYVRVPKRVTVTCKLATCGEEFLTTPKSTQKYCSISCSTTDNNTGKVRSNRIRCGYVYCNERVNNSQAIYCSIEHSARGKELDKAFIAITTGEMPVSHEPSKNLLKFLYGASCHLNDCGIDSWKGGDVPLILDHIDGKSDNHTLPNLRLVCGNCDMLLPTYKSKNKGNGRHSRRQRYAEGKSY